MKKAITYLAFFAATLTTAAQTSLPILHTRENPISYSENGRRPSAWFLSPEQRPDVLKTSAKEITFWSATDTLSFKLEEDGIVDFIVLTPEGDSAFTRVQWVSDNPLQNPPKEILGLSPTGRMSRQQAVFDINALVFNLYDIHPNLFATCKMQTFMQQVQDVKNNLPDSLTRLDLYRLAAPLVSMLGDGHTIMTFPFNDIFTRDLRRLPILVEIDKNDATVSVRRTPDAALPEGARILAINNVKAEEMITRMLSYSSGEKRFFRLSRINGLFPALFELLYHADNYEISFMDGRKQKSITLPAMTMAEMEQKILPPKEQKKHDPRPYFYEIPDGANYAVMTFNACDDPQRMSNLADSLVADLRRRNIRNLIIDVRQNGGGNSQVGDELLRRISPVPFQQFGNTYIRVTPTTLRFANRKGSAGIVYHSTRALVQPLPAEQRFPGKTILLVSHDTFSSGASFSWAFKYFGIGTVVGEETGGMNVSFGEFIRYRLPVSGLTTTVSYKRFWQYGADENDIHGTLPDHNIPQAEALDYAIKKLCKKK